MATLHITTPDQLDDTSAQIVRLKIRLTEITAAHDARKAALDREFEPGAAQLREQINELTGLCRQYAEAHINDPHVFADKKRSRDTTLCVLGFRWTPPRVETANKKIKWADVVARLLRSTWGKAYVRRADPKPDKEALLSDRDTLTPEQLQAAGVRFCQDEEFFIDPKPDTANVVPH